MESARFIIAKRLGQIFSWCLVFTLVACGGSSGKSSSAPSSSSSTFSVSSSSTGSSSVSTLVTISGTATYAFIPYHADRIGLDYMAAETRPIRGALVELIDADDDLIARSITDENGFYRVESPRATPVRVRIKARLLRTAAPAWDVMVADNTGGNALYILVGGLTDSGLSNSQRNLHAPSGWDGSGYTSTRAAAPFAILDTIYTGLHRLLDAGNTQNLRPLEFRWSPNNVTAINPDHDYSTGEIGTSFFDLDAIYLLGEADVDTDEYDPHVVLHEWTHYLEDALARSDTIGGAHGYGDRLDMRVAHSEGLANALAAMLLDDKDYRDSGGARQAGGYSYDMTEAHHMHAGWYNEASVESVLYNYYLSSSNKNSRDLSYILNAFSAANYRRTPGFTSIHLFVEQLQTLYPAHKEILDTLLQEQLIFGRGIFADGETNAANYSAVLPVYKRLSPDAVPIEICSSSRFGKYNKLGVAQFLLLDIAEEDSYQILVTKKTGSSAVTDPDFVLLDRGREITRAESARADLESARVVLPAGQYLLEIYDWNNRDDRKSNSTTSCFDVQVTQ